MAQILLVEDDAPMAELYERALLGQGYDVLVARNSREATDLLSQYPVDLILLDMTLPDAPGTMVLDYLEQEPGLENIRVIVMTGFPRYLKQADRASVVKTLAKPVTASHLLHVVETTLSSQD